MKKRLTFKGLSIILLLVLFSFNCVRQEIIMKRIQENIVASEEQLKELNDKNAKLQSELNEAGSDAYIEKLARERLGMIKKGEQVVNSKN